MTCKGARMARGQEESSPSLAQRCLLQPDQKLLQQTQKAEDAKSCRNKNNYIPFKELLKLDKIQVWNTHDFSELQQMHAWHLKYCFCHEYSQLHSLPIHLKAWRRRISRCSRALDASQSGECWRRRNATSRPLLIGGKIGEQRYRQALDLQCTKTNRMLYFCPQMSQIKHKANKLWLYIILGYFHLSPCFS